MNEMTDTAKAIVGGLLIALFGIVGASLIAAFFGVLTP